jgi:hypothetical protein
MRERWSSIELKKILQAKVPDVAMLPNAFCFGSVGRIAAKRAIDSRPNRNLAAVRTLVPTFFGKHLNSNRCLLP